MQVASRIRQIPPSATLALNAKANQLKAQGVDIVNFGVGEPDFDTPDNIREAAIRAINEGFTRYTPVGGIPELKEAIIDKFQGDYGLTYKPARDPGVLRRQARPLQPLPDHVRARGRSGDPGALLGVVRAHGHAGRGRAGASSPPGRPTASSSPRRN